MDISATRRLFHDFISLGAQDRAEFNAMVYALEYRPENIELAKPLAPAPRSTRTPAAKGKTAKSTGRRQMSAEGKARIAAATRKRWIAFRAAKQPKTRTAAE